MCDLSIIIPSFNTKDITKECLERLVSCITTSNTSSSKPITVEIIVVDNASTDGSVEMLTSLMPSLQTKEITPVAVYNNVAFISQRPGFPMLRLQSFRSYGKAFKALGLRFEPGT